MNKESNCINLSISKLCLLISFAFSIATVQSESNNENIDNYQIELIIFANQEKYNAVEEHWPTTVALNYPDTLISLTDTDDRISQGIQLQSFNELTNALKALKQSRRYKILFAKSWTQPLQYKQTLPFIHISGGQTIEGVDELAGGIQLYRARYIHINTRLWYVDFLDNISTLSTSTSLDYKPMNAQENNAQWPIPPQNPYTTSEKLPDDEYYNAAYQPPHEENRGQAGLTKTYTNAIKRIGTLHIKRRLKPNRIHYIDHPLLGVLIQVYKPK